MSRPFDPTLPPRPDGSPSGARIRLICVEGGGPSVSVDTSRPGVERLGIGRGTDNDLVLPDDRVSRRHALLTCRDAACFLEDLGSSNGSRVNGRDLQPGRSQLLRHLDEVKFGDLLYLFLDLGGDASGGLAVELTGELDRAAIDAEVDRLLADFRIGRGPAAPPAADAHSPVQPSDPQD